MLSWLTSFLPFVAQLETTPPTPLPFQDTATTPIDASTPHTSVSNDAGGIPGASIPPSFLGKLAASFDGLFSPSLTGGRSSARIADLSSGLGMPGRDPFYSQYWSAGTLTSESTVEIDALKRDGLVRKIIGAPWSDALRPWFDIRGMSPKLQDTVQFHLRRLHTKQQLWHLNFLRDIWGEAILLVGANDFPIAFENRDQDREHFATELNLDLLAKNQEILWLRPFGKKSAWGYESGFIPRIQANVHSPLFGNPLYFEITNFGAPAKPGYTDLVAPGNVGPLIVHNSRLIHATTPDALSRLVEIDPYLKAYQGGLASLGQLLRSSSVSFIKIANWLHKTSNNRAESHARLALAALSMSSLGAIFLDKDYEDHEFQSRPLSGASDILASFQEALCGASSSPMALLFGTEPRGFASAEEVTERYNTGVVDRQETNLTPQLEWLIELILTAYVPAHERPQPNTWTIEWRPLRMASELEKAKIRKATFDALKVENEAIAAGIGIPGALSAKEIRSTQGADRFSVDPVLDPLVPTTQVLPKTPMMPPSQEPGQPPADDTQDTPVDLSEAQLVKQESLAQQAQLLEEIREMGDELKTANELAQEFNLPVRVVLKQLKSNPNQRFMKGYGPRGSTAYSKSDFLGHCINNATLKKCSASNKEAVSQDPFENWHTARQKNPKDFKDLKVIKKTKEGIQLRGGIYKDTGKVEVQSVWIPSDMDVAKAKKWLIKHDFNASQFEEAKDA